MDAAAREYRIVLRRIRPTPAGEAPQFTLIVTAADPETAVGEAEKVVEVLNHEFSVIDIKPLRPCPPDGPRMELVPVWQDRA